MSVSLTIIKKGNTRLNVSAIIKDYFDALEGSYINSELETAPQLYCEHKGVLGFVCEGALSKEIESEGLSVQPFKLAKRDLILVKLAHENNEDSRKKVLDTIQNLNLPDSLFISLEHTGRHYTDLSQQPPRFTLAKNVYLPVGTITKYFQENTLGTAPSKDTRGVEFAKAREGKDMEDIITEYFSEALDNNNFENIMDPGKSGLQHLTTFLHNTDGKLTISFVQHKSQKSASYFFDPDTVFCSDVCILRVLRHHLYPNSPIRRSLGQTSVTIS